MTERGSTRAENEVMSVTDNLSPSSCSYIVSLMAEMRTIHSKRVVPKMCHRWPIHSRENRSNTIYKAVHAQKMARG